MRKEGVVPYTLYGFPRAGSCIVELALAEIGADYEFKGFDLKTDAQRDVGYAAVNPQRKLPTIIFPDGDVMTESTAIILALDRRHPEAGLLPAVASPDYLQSLRWLTFVAAEIYPIVEINDYPERLTADPESDPAGMRENARRIWRDRWRLVEENVSGDPYFLLSGCTLADLYIAVVSRWAQQDEWRPTHIPKVERIAEAVSTREACAPVWKRNFG